MPIYALGDMTPTIADDAFIHPEAVIIGDVRIGSESTVWPGAVLRGDDGHITIGERTSIQDGTVIHTTRHQPTTIGNDCVIGHMVHLEGCTIHDGSLVGSGSVVLHGAVVETGGLVGANAVVNTNKVVPGGAMALGVPAVIKPDRANLTLITMSAEFYVERGHRYRNEMRRLD